MVSVSTSPWWVPLVCEGPSAHGVERGAPPAAPGVLRGGHWEAKAPKRSLICGTHMSSLKKFFSALTTRANTPAQIIANLKKVVISGMVREAKSRLAIKIDREGWKGGIDHIWVELVAGAPKRQCGGIARYTLLRWAVKMMTSG